MRLKKRNHRSAPKRHIVEVRTQQALIHLRSETSIRNLHHLIHLFYCSYHHLYYLVHFPVVVGDEEIVVTLQSFQKFTLRALRPLPLSTTRAPAKFPCSSATSLISLSAFHGTNGQSNNPPSIRPMAENQHDTSMDELASRLLDDSNLSQFQTHQGRRLSQHSIVHVLHRLPDSPRGQKDLPQLPQLLFNDDDAWALQFQSAQTADSGSNNVGFVGNGSGNSPSENIQGQTTKRKSFVPSLPPRSSMRATARERHRKQVTLKAAEAARSRLRHEKKESKKPLISSPIPIKSKRPLISSPIPIVRTPPEQTQSSPLSMAPSNSNDHQAHNNDLNASSNPIVPGQEAPIDKPLDVNGKIQAMLDATEQLKGKKKGTLLRTPAKKVKNANIFSRVKHALTSHRHDYWRKPHDSARDDHLLDDELNQPPELDPEDQFSSSISAVESCVNEGMSLSTCSDFCLDYLITFCKTPYRKLTCLIC